jgi:hypothetical protein
MLLAGAGFLSAAAQARRAGLLESRVEGAWRAPAAAGRECPDASAKPPLVVTPGGFDFRVARRHRRSWNDAERIDIREAAGRVNVDMTFRGALLTFSASLGAVSLAAHVLSPVPASVPLSNRAVSVKTMVA